jgi:predicted Fe-Mo cluster-binding NifX family protein
MKICICATASDLDSQVSPVFGRCPYFLIIDSETEKFKAIVNSAGQASRGAGVAAAQIAASEGAKVVICGNFGPSSFSVLQMAGIRIYPGVLGLNCKQVLDKYKKGELKEIKISPAPGLFGPPGGRRGFGPGPGGQGRRRRGR